MLTNYLQKILNAKNNFIIFFFFCLFFPFFIKINIFNHFIINLKDVVFLMSAILLHILKINKIKNRKNISLINYLLIIILIIHIFSSLFLLYIAKKYSIHFYQYFFRSFVICYGSIIFFFIFEQFLNKKNFIFIIKLFYFIHLLIFIEFFISIILKSIFDFSILKVMYPENIFRSLIINGHIVTTIFLCCAIILGFYLYELKKEKKYLISNILLSIPVFSNIETRLTIFAFIFSLILLFLFKQKKKYNLKFIIISNFVFLLILLGIVIFSKIEDKDYFVNIFEYKIFTSSLFDRINLFILSIIAFFNYPYGYGFQTSGLFFSNIKFVPNIFIGDMDLFASFLTFSNNFIEIHNVPIKDHSYITNILNSFGIFLFPIYLILKKYNSRKKYFSENIKFYVCIILIFLSTAALLNYTYETELLTVFFLSIYWCFYKRI